MSKIRVACPLCPSPGPTYSHDTYSSVINIYMLTEDTTKSIIKILVYYPALQYISSNESYRLEFLSGFHFKHVLQTAAIFNVDFIFSWLAMWYPGVVLVCIVS